MVDSVVDFLLQNLPRLLNDELKLLSGVEDKVHSLCNELKFIDIFLKSSIGKRDNDIVKEVVNQIRAVAYKAENVVDIYISNITRHRQRNIFSKLFHMRERIGVLHKVDTEIQKIKTSIDEIYKNKERYGITEGDFKTEQVAAVVRQWRREKVEEKDVVGLVHDSAYVTQQLMGGESVCQVVSIIGMGGLGKTTLARKIYNSNQVVNLFPYRAWGYVSNDYRPSDLLQSLLKCLPFTAEEAGAENDEQLKKKLRERLRENKYLVVLDDIWKTQVWDEVKDAFPDEKNGSRILITSRIKDVALYAGTISPYHLPFLKPDESWELFSKKVFQGKVCPSELEPLGKSIVQSCKGLPLAVVVLAGLVAKKEKSQREWERLNISWQLTEDKIEVMDILRLSYNNLPQRLKPCFLYFAIYPEDYEICVKDVIQMWIAEGFIQPLEATKELEDIADYYLDELVDRSLIQVASRRSDGGVKTCRIHDLLRDLCILESKSEEFLVICTEPNNLDTMINANPHRLSFHCKAKSESNVSTKNCNQLCTRSLFFFSNKRKQYYPEDVVDRLKLARVLYSNDNGLALYSVDWEMMIHLRYLKVSNSVGVIPASVSNLWNLETLNVEFAGRVPSEIWKLKRLRHLYLRRVLNVEVPPESDGKIKTNLQTLWLGMDKYEEMELLLKMDIFPHLKKLVLQILQSMRRHRLPILCHLSSLQNLKIYGEFTLVYPGQNNIFLTLGQLTNLRILKLINHPYFEDGFDINLGAGDFPQLEVFKMEGINVSRWTLEKGAVPRLRHLVIDRCKYLDELPGQLWCFTTSLQVHVLHPNSALAESLRNVELKNGSKLILSP